VSGAAAIVSALREGGRCAVRVDLAGLGRAVLRDATPAGGGKSPGHARSRAVPVRDAEAAALADGVAVRSSTETGLGVVTVYEWRGGAAS
jgi:hypothetical protein